MPDKPDLELEFPTILEAAVENKLSPEEAMFLLSARMTEQGGKGFEYGVKRAKGTHLRRQAGEAAVSIYNNRERYEKYIRAGGKPNYTEFFAHHGGPVGKGWAPIKDVPKWEEDLNRNWPKNQDRFLGDMLPIWMPRIKEYYDDSERRNVLKGKQTSPIR